MTKEIDRAYRQGELGIRFPRSQANPQILHKWAQKNGIHATGKFVGDEWKVVFWEFFDKIVEA